MRRDKERRGEENGKASQPSIEGRYTGDFYSRNYKVATYLLATRKAPSYPVGLKDY
jgi:hypothetical protein